MDVEPEPNNMGQKIEVLLGTSQRTGWEHNGNAVGTHWEHTEVPQKNPPPNQAIIRFDVNLKMDLVWEFIWHNLCMHACKTHVTASCCRKLQGANSR